MKKSNELWRNKEVEEFSTDYSAFRRYAELRKFGVKGVCMMPFDDKFLLLYEKCAAMRLQQRLSA